jgi:hypothetical protein
VAQGFDDVDVDRAEYEAAKAAGELDQMLDVYTSDIDTEAYVVEPNGTAITLPDGNVMAPTISEQVLACPMEPNDADATTVGHYLLKLLAMVWDEGEGFSGKRPFGNSGWQYAIYIALGKAGLISVLLDADGYVDECDDEAADAMVAEAIKSLAVS